MGRDFLNATQQVNDTPNSWVSIPSQLYLSITFLKHIQYAKHCSKGAIDLSPFSSWQPYVVGPLSLKSSFIKHVWRAYDTPGTVLGRQRCIRTFGVSLPPVYSTVRGANTPQRDNTWTNSHAQDPFRSEPVIWSTQEWAGRDAHQQSMIIQHTKCYPSEEAALRRRIKNTQLVSQMGLEVQSREGTGRLALGMPESSLRHCGGDSNELCSHRDMGEISAALCPFQIVWFFSETQLPPQRNGSMIPTYQGDCEAQIKQCLGNRSTISASVNPLSLQHLSKAGILEFGAVRSLDKAYFYDLLCQRTLPPESPEFI